MRPRLCLALCVLAFALTGCNARRDGALDTEMARLVDRVEQRVEAERRAELAVAALAARDLAPIEYASAGMALETLGLLYIPDPRQKVARRGSETESETIAPSEWLPNWIHGPHPSWLAHQTPSPTEVTDPMMPDLAWTPLAEWDDMGDNESSEASDEGRPGRRRGSGRSKPKIRVNLFQLRVAGQPVSFSGSVKDLKGVQIKLKVRL